MFLLNFCLFFKLSHLIFLLISIGFINFLMLLVLAVLRLCFMLLKIVLLLCFFPFSNFSHLFHILTLNLFAYFLGLLPLLLLLLWHYITLWWLVCFCLCDPVNKASISCLLTNIDFPHLVFLLDTLIFFVVFLYIILC